MGKGLTFFKDGCASESHASHWPCALSFAAKASISSIVLNRILFTLQNKVHTNIHKAKTTT
jgi:hypothetical protein